MEKTGGPKRNIYLRKKTLDDARVIWRVATGNLRAPVETVPVRESLGRVTSAPVNASRSVPHYHGAAMDGYAVRAEETYDARETHPLLLTEGVSAVAVDTGDPLPPGTDAVIMIEHAVSVSGTEIEIRAAAFPWQHVRKVGEDIVAGEMVLSRSHRIRPADVGALLSAGICEIEVYRRPRVFILPTGSELSAPEDASSAEPGRIVEFNGAILAGMVSECGGEAVLAASVPDDYESIRRAVEDALESDAGVILINAGSSAGSEDYTAAVMAETGKVLVHGVAMMPGKPTVLGTARGKPVVGIPGYPVSAILAFEQFVRPLLFGLQGLAEPAFAEVEAVLGRKTPSRLGLEEFVRVIMGRVGGELIAMPLRRGAGVVTSLTRADGILRIPQESEGVGDGRRVTVRLLRGTEELDHTLIMIGSHDNTLDLLADGLRARDGRIRLSSSNVGSLGGLLAVRRGRAHLAGSHLLDTKTGGYNHSYVEWHLAGFPVRLVRLAIRSQGLLVRKGNPKDIRGIEDLCRPDVEFINRQAGSGTRVLLDHRLASAGCSPEEIRGYDQEETTHMAVAVAVLSGRADAGMAVYSSARALGLDFIPVADERYDLVIPETGMDDHKIRVLLEIVSSGSFRREVAALGGYDVSGSGEVMGIWDGEKWTSR